MPKNYFKILFISTLIIYSFLLTPNSALAQGALLSDGPGADYSKDCIKSGDCQLSDFTVLLVRISQIILGLTGSLALLAFVYGGVLFLSSGGNKEMVEKGKHTLIGAAIGIFIVFASYTIIGFTINAFNPEVNAAWSSSGWFSRLQTK